MYSNLDGKWHSMGVKSCKMFLLGLSQIISGFWMRQYHWSSTQCREESLMCRVKPLALHLPFKQRIKGNLETLHTFNLAHGWHHRLSRVYFSVRRRSCLIMTAQIICVRWFHNSNAAPCPLPAAKSRVSCSCSRFGFFIPATVHVQARYLKKQSISCYWIMAILSAPCIGWWQMIVWRQLFISAACCTEKGAPNHDCTNDLCLLVS